MVFHQQDAQRHRSLRRGRTLVRRIFAAEMRLKGHCRGGAEAAAATAHLDRASMHLDQVLANCESQPKPSKFSRDPPLTLFERGEKRCLFVERDPDARVCDGKLEIVAIIPSL